VSYLASAEVPHDVSEETQESLINFRDYFKKQYSVLSLPEIIKIYQVPLREVLSGFIEQ
jgi:hypothetical protein